MCHNNNGCYLAASQRTVTLTAIVLPIVHRWITLELWKKGELIFLNRKKNIFIMLSSCFNHYWLFLYSKCRASPLNILKRMSKRWTAGIASSVALITSEEKQRVNHLLSNDAHWTPARSALRLLGLNSATFDPWETLVHNNTRQQYGPSSLCP